MTQRTDALTILLTKHGRRLTTAPLETGCECAGCSPERHDHDVDGCDTWCGACRLVVRSAVAEHAQLPAPDGPALLAGLYGALGLADECDALALEFLVRIEVNAMARA